MNDGCIDKAKLRKVLAITTHFGIEDAQVTRILQPDDNDDTPELEAWLDDALAEDLATHVLWLTDWLRDKERKLLDQRPLNQN